MMQDSFDALTLHSGEGPELMIGLGICSPLMLSPTDESSNPFFISTGSNATHLDHLSYSLIMDGECAVQKKRHLLTPQDLSLFSHFNQESEEDKKSEDCDEDDFFSMISSIKRQRLFESPVPFYSTSPSHISSASSTTPSEAGSDLDAETQMLHLDMTPFNFGLRGDHMDAGAYNTNDKMQCGSLQHAGSELTVRSQRRPDNSDCEALGPQQDGHAGMMGFNTFNLSDFISDHEQESQHQLQSEQRTDQDMDPHSLLFSTPDRPVRHQVVRSLTSSRPNIYSPVSSMSPATPGLDDGLFRPVQIAGRGEHMRAEREAGRDQAADTNGRRAQDLFMNRCKMPMRSYSNLLESLSCNPSQITPPQRQMMEAGSDEGSYFFSSSSVNDHSDGVDSMVEGDEEASISPPTPYSFINNDACPNLWSLASSDAYQRDVFDGQSSPMSDPEGTPLKMPHFSQTSDFNGGQQQQQPHAGVETDSHQSGLGLQGVQKRGFRSGRVSTLASSRFSASPYQSPLLNKSLDLSDPRSIVIGGQIVTGIITKRSRGRRVPNNPQEINNLGKSGKVYTCKVPGCGKCFKRSEHLKRHVRSIHTNEKPYTCHCGKTFSRHDNLNQHARVHGGGGSPMSQPSSLSPTGSPLTLPSGYAESHIEAGRRASVTRVSSRLRKAIGAGEVGMYAEMDEDDEDSHDD